MPYFDKRITRSAGLLVLIITLSVGLFATNNTLKKFFINSYARYSPDALIRQRERAGGCTGKYCLADEIMSNIENNQNDMAAMEVVETYTNAVNGDQEAMEILRANNVALAKQAADKAKAIQALNENATLQRDIEILTEFSSTVFVYQSGGSPLSPCINDATRMCDLDSNAVLICQSRGGTDCSLHPREFAIDFLSNNGIDQTTINNINATYSSENDTYTNQVIQNNRALTDANNRQIAINAINSYYQSQGSYTFSSIEDKAIVDLCVQEKGTIISTSCKDAKTYADVFITENSTSLEDQFPQAASIPVPLTNSIGTPSFVSDPITYNNSISNLSQNPSVVNAVNEAAIRESTDFSSFPIEYKACQDAVNAVERFSCNQKMYNAEMALTQNNPIARITGIDNYIESFASGTTQAWQTLGYESIDKCKVEHPNGLGPLGYGCGSTDYTKEQLTASITAGSRITEIASLPVSIGYAASAPTILAGIGRAFGEIGVISTVDQTANTANAWVNDPGSRETWTQTGLTALSWTNLGTADMISNALARGGLTTLDRAINTTVSAVNLAVDLPTAYNTWQNDDSSGWDRATTVGAVIFDVAGGIIDLREGQLIWDPKNSHQIQNAILPSGNNTINTNQPLRDRGLANNPANSTNVLDPTTNTPSNPQQANMNNVGLSMNTTPNTIATTGQGPITIALENIYNRLFPNAVDTQGIRFDQNDVRVDTTAPVAPAPRRTPTEALSGMIDGIRTRATTTIERVLQPQIPDTKAQRVQTGSQMTANTADTQGVRAGQGSNNGNMLQRFLTGSAATGQIPIPTTIIREVGTSAVTLASNTIQQITQTTRSIATNLVNGVNDFIAGVFLGRQDLTPNRTTAQAPANIDTRVQTGSQMTANTADTQGVRAGQLQQVQEKITGALTYLFNTISFKYETVWMLNPDQTIRLRPGSEIFNHSARYGTHSVRIPRIGENGITHYKINGDWLPIPREGIPIKVSDIRNLTWGDVAEVRFGDVKGHEVQSISIGQDSLVHANAVEGINTPTNNQNLSSGRPETQAQTREQARNISQFLLKGTQITIQPIIDRLSRFTDAIYNYVTNNPPEYARQAELPDSTRRQTSGISIDVSDSIGPTLRTAKVVLLATGLISFACTVFAITYTSGNVSTSSLSVTIPTFTPTAIVRMLTNTPISPTTTPTTTAPQYLENGTVLLTTDLAPDKYKLISYLVDIFNQAMKELGGIPTNQEEKNNYIKKVISLLTSSNQSPEMLRMGTQLANDNNFINYLNSRLNGADLGLRDNQLIQCNIWAVGISVIYPDLNIVADRYQFTNGGAFYLSEIYKSTTNDMQCFGKTMKEALFDPRCQDRELRYQVEGDVIAARVTDYSRINAGDSFVYDYHIGVILDKYYINGKYWFLVTESNSPHDSPTGTPQMYLVNQDDFASRINDLNKTYFLYSGNDATVEKPTTPASATTPEVLRMITVPNAPSGQSQNAPTFTYAPTITATATTGSIQRNGDSLVRSENMFNGYVKYFEYITNNTRQETSYHVLSIDLDHAKFFVTPPNDPSKKTSDNLMTTGGFLDKYNMDIAINADGWYSYTDQFGVRHYKTNGLAASNGTVYGSNTEQTIFIDQNNNISIAPQDRPDQIWNAVSFPNQLIKNGIVMPHPDKTDTNPRTALGVTADNRLILVTVDGIEYSSGTTVDELTRLLQGMGAIDAVMFDSGTSSTMVVRDANGNPSTLNQTTCDSYTTQCQVANHLGIQIIP